MFDKGLEEEINEKIKFIEVSYHGEKYPIKNDKVISCHNTLQ